MFNYKLIYCISFYFVNLFSCLPENVIKGISNKKDKKLQEYLSNKGNINAQSERLLYSSLHLAITYGANSIAKNLIDKGIELDLQNDQGYTALMISAMQHNLEIMLYILLKDVNLEIKNHKGRTALHVAAHVGFYEGVLILTQVGCDIYSVDNNGKKPIELAQIFLNENQELKPERKNEYKKIIKFLHDQEATTNHLSDSIKCLPEELINLIRLKLIKD